MKKHWSTLVLASLLLSPNVYADPSTADRQTVLNNVTDLLATVGKDPQDKKEILKDRRDIRREARLKSEARRKQEDTRKKMKAQEEIILRKVRSNSN